MVENFLRYTGARKDPPSKQNFDGLCPISLEPLVVQKSYVPHWKALLFSQYEPEGQGLWFPNRAAMPTSMKLNCFCFSKPGGFVCWLYPLSFWLIIAVYQGFEMIYITSLQDKWLKIYEPSKLNDRKKNPVLLSKSSFFSIVQL